MYKLLVVDDEPTSRDTLCHCFPWQSLGFQIAAQADDGSDALDYLQTHTVDVVLCDIKMPAMSGIELARSIQDRNAKPAIIFLSAYQNFEFAQQALAYGVRYYLVKPAGYEIIAETFQKLRQELDAKAELDKALRRETRLKSLDPHDFQENLIRIVKDYLDQNYCYATLEEAAALVHINASYLSQLFKQKTGVNFSDYLIAVKMGKAAQLLNNLHLKIYDISEMVGYQNAKNFTRMFKLFYGVNPREYRNLKLTGVLLKNATTSDEATSDVSSAK